MRTTVSVLGCDACKAPILDGDLWIDFGANGVHFHWRCLKAINALEFIILALDGGDQMFVRDSLQDTAPWIQLNHLGWKENPDNLKNILSAHKMSMTL